MIDNRIRQERIRLGLTVPDVARATGVPAETVKAWNMGRRVPPPYVEAMVLKAMQESVRPSLEDKIRRDLSSLSPDARAYAEKLLKYIERYQK